MRPPSAGSASSGRHEPEVPGQPLRRPVGRRDVHHAEAALNLALLALQLVASSLGSRSCGEEEEDDDGCPGAVAGAPGV